MKKKLTLKFKINSYFETGNVMGALIEQLLRLLDFQQESNTSKIIHCLLLKYLKTVMSLLKCCFSSDEEKGLKNRSTKNKSLVKWTKIWSFLHRLNLACSSNYLYSFGGHNSENRRKSSTLILFPLENNPSGWRASIINKIYFKK